MMKKLLFIYATIFMSALSAQAQEVVDARQDGETIILEYNMPKKSRNVKFFYQYQSDNKPNYIGELNNVPKGDGVFVWDLSKTNTLLTGESLSFSMDADFTKTTNILVMASGFANYGVKAGMLFYNHGFYISPGISIDNRNFGFSAGYTGKHKNWGWYIGGGYTSLTDQVETLEPVLSTEGYYQSWVNKTYVTPLLEVGAIYYIKGKFAISAGLSYDTGTSNEKGKVLPQLGLGWLF